MQTALNSCTATDTRWCKNLISFTRVAHQKRRGMPAQLPQEEPFSRADRSHCFDCHGQNKYSVLSSVYTLSPSALLPCCWSSPWRRSLMMMSTKRPDPCAMGSKTFHSGIFCWISACLIYYLSSLNDKLSVMNNAMHYETFGRLT